MDSVTAVELVRLIHGASGKICLVVTGAGSDAVAALFAEPGASRTMLDAQIPYSSSAMNLYTGHIADQHVSAEEAQLMASAALEKAESLSEEDELVAGISCTAAIATDRVRRGENRCHIGIVTSRGLRKTYSLTLDKGKRNRAGEETVCSAIILNAVAEAKEIDERSPVTLLNSEHVIERDFS